MFTGRRTKITSAEASWRATTSKRRPQAGEWFRLVHRANSTCRLSPWSVAVLSEVPSRQHARASTACSLCFLVTSGFWSMHCTVMLQEGQQFDYMNFAFRRMMAEASAPPRQASHFQASIFVKIKVCTAVVFFKNSRNTTLGRATCPVIPCTPLHRVPGIVSSSLFFSLL